MPRIIVIILISLLGFSVSYQSYALDLLDEITLNKAKQGDADAQNNLGVMYSEGSRIPKDDKQAFYWYEKSAQQGNSTAQFNFGAMYYNGKGTPQDYKLAYVWFNVASAQGNEGAKKARDVVGEKLTPSALTEAQTLSTEYYKKYGAKE